jgi:hypothetical protein
VLRVALLQLDLDEPSLTVVDTGLTVPAVEPIIAFVY